MDVLTVIAFLASTFAAVANLYQSYQAPGSRWYYFAISTVALAFAISYGLDLADIIDPLHIGGGTNILRPLQISVMLILGSFALWGKRGG
jgi:hypothetical protein